MEPTDITAVFVAAFVATFNVHGFVLVITVVD